MFNNDFYELKKALEVVTLEVTDLKKRLHEKDIEIQNLQAHNNQLKQIFLDNNAGELRQKIVEQDVQIRELITDKNQAERKIVQLRGDIQSLNDRIAGLIKENDNLKREAIARQMLNKTFNGVKGLVNNLNTKKRE